MCEVSQDEVGVEGTGEGYRRKDENVRLGHGAVGGVKVGRNEGRKDCIEGGLTVFVQGWNGKGEGARVG